MNNGRAKRETQRYCLIPLKCLRKELGWEIPILETNAKRDLRVKQFFMNTGLLKEDSRFIQKKSELVCSPTQMHLGIL